MNLETQFLNHESKKFDKTKNNTTSEFNFEKTMKLSIFFIRGKSKFVVEEWFVILNHIDISKGKTLRKGYLMKKLTCLVRSIMTLTRILPLYSLSRKPGFDYTFEYCIDSSFEIGNKNRNTILLNKISDKIGNIIIKCNYISKKEIFHIEDMIVKLPNLEKKVIK